MISSLSLSMIFSENRYPLFRIMLYASQPDGSFNALRNLSNAFGRHGLTSIGGFARYVFATVLESVVLGLVSGLVSGLVLGLGLESGILGLGLGRTEATILVLASLSVLASVLVSCRFPPTIWPASFEMAGVGSAGGIGATNEIS